jgi:hypothetical protein
MLALARGPVGIEGAYQCVTDQQELDVAPLSEVIIALYHLRLQACAIIEVLTYGRHSSEPSIWPWVSDWSTHQVNIPKSPSVNPPRQCRRRTQERFQQGKGAAGLVNPSEEPHETRGRYGRSAAPSNSAPCRPPCHAPGCTLGIWEWGLDGLAETVGLLVSELVTNAVQAMVRQGGHTAVRLQLFGDNARVRIEVWDAESRPPAPRDPGQDGIPDVEGEGGRGLVLVAAPSACRDWYLTQEPAGKVVWCELEAERPELSEVGGPASQPLLPRRMPRQVQVRPVVVMNDPDILRRIRDGLRDLGDC